MSWTSRVQVKVEERWGPLITGQTLHPTADFHQDSEPGQHKCRPGVGVGEWGRGVGGCFMTTHIAHNWKESLKNQYDFFF